ncbi:MAG: threonine synthase [Bernardetiaceae bacterium]
MQFYSTAQQSPLTDWKTVVFRGLAPDSGLFMPERIPTVWTSDLYPSSLPEIGYAVARAFLPAELISDKALRTLVEESLNFPIPLVALDEQIHTLELFHGPTLAFKDVGARFMARIMGFLREPSEELVVLAATSGDTGSAVASGFFDVPGIRVVLLFPKGRVSRLQEQQLTTWGHNITALEVSGTFDDCQRLVKMAFQDQTLRKRLTLTSANSINFARLLPQSFYYFYALAQLPKEKRKKVVFAVPSGNFGHLTAGLLAERMGMPVQYFIAATNANDVVPEYLSTGKFQPRPSIPTISNAMDVGNPSNFDRMLALFGGDHAAMQARVRGFCLNDAQTTAVLQDIYTQHHYLADPHGAIGYAALKHYLAPDETGIFLETAHPSKFGEPVTAATGEVPPMPERLSQTLQKQKQSTPLSAQWEDFRDFLLNF